MASLTAYVEEILGDRQQNATHFDEGEVIYYLKVVLQRRIRWSGDFSFRLLLIHSIQQCCSGGRILWCVIE